MHLNFTKNVLQTCSLRVMNDQNKKTEVSKIEYSYSFPMHEELHNIRLPEECIKLGNYWLRNQSSNHEPIGKLYTYTNLINRYINRCINRQVSLFTGENVRELNSITLTKLKKVLCFCKK